MSEVTHVEFNVLSSKFLLIALELEVFFTVDESIMMKTPNEEVDFDTEFEEREYDEKNKALGEWIAKKMEAIELLVLVILTAQ